MPTRQRRHIYVINLKPSVLEKSNFRKANPDYVQGKRCVYVGVTALEPEERFAQHKAGKKSGKFVERFGTNLLPSLGRRTYRSSATAERIERKVAADLRAKGYGVWQN